MKPIPLGASILLGEFVSENPGVSVVGLSPVWTVFFAGVNRALSAHIKTRTMNKNRGQGYTVKFIDIDALILSIEDAAKDLRASLEANYKRGKPSNADTAEEYVREER